MNAYQDWSFRTRKARRDGHLSALSRGRLTFSDNLYCRGDGVIRPLVPQSIVGPIDQYRMRLPLMFCPSCFVRARRLNVIIQPHLRFV